MERTLNVIDTVYGVSVRTRTLALPITMIILCYIVRLLLLIFHLILIREPLYADEQLNARNNISEIKKVGSVAL